MFRLSRSQFPRLGFPIAFALVLAACQAGGASPSSGTASVEASTPASPSQVASTAPAADATVVAASSAAIGDYLTDADGNTVYIFLNDSPGETSCFDSCLESWPPLTVDGGAAAVAGDGISGELGTIERDDGSTQVTLDGWPLYYFAGDAAAGDTNGQGVGDKWFAAKPDGSVPGAASSVSSLYDY
jgi:predicted lipoprotein with Yx(FWY)xxD motif